MEVRGDMGNWVYITARDGHFKFLKVFLERCSRNEVERLVEAKTHGATPLVMACRNGHFEVVEYLIHECGADIEQTGSVVFDGQTVEDAPPLWCAAAAGYYKLVRFLVAKGARVNAMTKTNSTPLRAACFDGHFEIVRFLVNHGADIEAPNVHGHTCLMIACYRGHARITKYLLSLNANTNRKSVRGNTALHDCAESGSLDVVEMLVEHGAKMDVDSFGITPLLSAAITGHAHIVEYLTELPNFVSRKDKIDALELLGATYVDKKKDMVGGLEFWRRAMEERLYGNGPPIPKPCPTPAVAAYEFAQEITDFDALDDLLADPDEMRMQALVVRERILGEGHPDTSYYIRYRGAVYADNGKFSRGIELWNYALDMQQRMHEPLNPMTQSSFLSFTELFNFMIGEDSRRSEGARKIPPVEREDILKVLRKAIREVEAGKRMFKATLASDPFWHEYLGRMLAVTLQLSYLATREMPEPDTQEWFDLHKVLYKLVRLDVKSSDGSSLFVLAHSVDSTLAVKCPDRTFPSLNLTLALLRVGADPNEHDYDLNTALHMTAHTQPWRPDIAEALLQAGAHIDKKNADGLTYHGILGLNNEPDTINHLKYTTLACLAARVVRKTHRERLEDVPKHLHDFVMMH